METSRFIQKRTSATGRPKDMVIDREDDRYHLLGLAAWISI
jgi:hypothetical protein